MAWGKIILIFQAIVTLIISLVFFSQLITIKSSDMNSIIKEATEGNISKDTGLTPTLSVIKQRYTVSAYLLLIVSLIELMILSRI